MGILRTDKISGLETPTAVTGSVEFDGTGDRLTLNNSNFVFGTSDFTVELFVYKPSTDQELFFSQLSNSATGRDGIALGYQSAKFWILQGNGSSWDLETTVGSFPTGRWVHFAVSRDYSASKTYYFIDGQLVYTYETNVNLTAANSGDIVIGNGGTTTDTYSFTGHISNLRILKGTALYTADFTPPTHELEVIGDTVLLCCNNPDSAGAEGTGKDITVNGDAAASTFSPGLTRDFTSGTEFKGVTTFDTQGYFVPPSGTTEQRDISLSTKPGGSGRAVSFGGEQSPLSPSVIRAIDTIVIPSLGDATDFGDLSQDNRKNTAASSSTRGLCVDGVTPSATNVIEFITFAATGSSTNFGDTVQNVVQSGGASNGIRGVFAGGYNDADFMEYVTIATEGNAQDFGDLIQRRFDLAGFASPTRGVFAGGKFTPSPTINQMNSIEYITIASTGNAKDFGDMTFASRGPVGTSSQIRGVIGGGFTTSPSNASFNSIDFITIASTGNAFDFGDLTSARNEIFGSTSNSLRAVFMGGDEAPGGSRVNTIDFVQIQTTGNAIDFGELTTPKSGASACSDSHGGLS